MVKIDRAGSPGDAESYYSAAPPPNLHNTPHARPHTRTFTSNTTHTQVLDFKKWKAILGFQSNIKDSIMPVLHPLPLVPMYQVHTMDPHTKFMTHFCTYTFIAPLLL